MWVIERFIQRTQHVYRYLGRYTHRVAISNARLVAMEDDRVRFRYKDYADGNRDKQITLTADEFIRRFLLHVLPLRFVRIRHYGLLASRNVATKLSRCQTLLGTAHVDNDFGPALPADTQPTAPVKPKAWHERLREWTGEDLMLCPRCRGPLRRCELDTPAGAWRGVFQPKKAASPVPLLDSS